MRTCKSALQFQMFLIANDTNKFIVVQSNELVEATYSPELTTRAHKVARFILSLISPDDRDLKLYTVPISTLKEFLGYKENTTWGNFYPEMKDIADRLNQEPIVIKSGDKVTTAYFIAGYEIDAAARTVTFEVSLLLKPYLLALKRNFTRYPLNYISQLRSAYSIRLYELLCQYKTIGYRTFELTALQLLLGSNYEFYGNFKDKVLAIAKRDLVANTDLDFDYEEIKTARKVTGIKFNILSNSDSRSTNEPMRLETATSNGSEMVKNTQTAQVPLFSKETLAQLGELGLKPVALKKYIHQGFDIIVDDAQREQAMLRSNNNLETYYIEKLKLCQQSKKDAKRNKVGFFIKALQEDWQWVKATQKATTISEKPLVNKDLQLKQKEAQIREIKKAWERAKQVVFNEIVADTEGYASIFETVKAQSGSLTSTIFPANVSPMDIFNNNGMGANLIKIKIEELYPEKFAAINISFRTALSNLEKGL